MPCIIATLRQPLNGLVEIFAEVSTGNGKSGVSRCFDHSAYVRKSPKMRVFYRPAQRKSQPPEIRWVTGWGRSHVRTRL